MSPALEALRDALKRAMAPHLRAPAANDDATRRRAEVFDLTRAKLDADREVVAYGLASPESEVAPGAANTLARLKGRRSEIGVAEIRRTAAFMTRMGWRTPVEGEDEGR